MYLQEDKENDVNEIEDETMDGTDDEVEDQDELDDEEVEVENGEGDSSKEEQSYRIEPYILLLSAGMQGELSRYATTLEDRTRAYDSYNDTPI